MTIPPNRNRDEELLMLIGEQMSDMKFRHNYEPHERHVCMSLDQFVPGRSETFKDLLESEADSL